MQRLKNVYQDFVSPEANTYHWSLGRKIASAFSGFLAGFIVGLITAWILQNSNSIMYE